MAYLPRSAATPLVHGMAPPAHAIAIEPGLEPNVPPQLCPQL